MRRLEFDDIDRAIAANIRRQRVARGWSQEKLGFLIGVTFQQIQKYENLKNRISARRLASMAEVFGCRLDDFLKRSVEERV
jgi:transcriptional regulator with XRE-family HTH domain